ncbi:MAG TPA: HAD-IB family hydrolase [Spirochaetota bacterium]|nr:HAD-IB family hydrolase [Spirochaetota bacterium]HPC41964.1 HAD-IB family hydrolase [Spirochaetota bacterium]HPL19104.1 HAD-IB family hydrolase [Spirochaetota bacterium]HQF06990.1 HAD-IB family hydrolase [Spirochaetota bacterium]HQH95727.1 HAD-IB family hydrolase [Spirochaetota bacterium]
MRNRFFHDELPKALIAFFDLDETITDADTDSLWASWRSRRHLKGWVERAWLSKLYRDFRRGGMSIEEYMLYQKFRIGRLAADEFRAMGEDFFKDAGRRHVYREAADLIRRLKQNGCRVVLLTAQNECIAGPYARYLDMNDMIANRFHDDGVRFTEPVRPYSFGEGKVELGKRYAAEAGVALGRCAFFGDSIYDAPFLEMVGFPCAVNPDRLLEARARDRNWPIARFSGLHVEG